MHQIKRLINIFELELMGNHRVDFDFSVHIPIDNFRHICAAFGPAESGAFPDAACDELKRAGRDFFARFGHANNNRDAPTTVTRFERVAHHIRIPRAVKCIIRAALGELYQMGH